MRDRYLQLFARWRRRPSNPVPPTDPIPAALEHRVQAAFPRPAVPDALRARVAHICREAVEAGPADRQPSPWNRRSRMRIARWGSAVLAGAAVVAIWMSHGPGEEALAATIRAMEAVPVIHVVSQGDQGGHGEIWLVDGVGSYLHSVGRDSEDLMVDDLRYQYRSLIPRGPGSGITEARIEVVPSQMADPKQKRAIWDGYTKAGMLKELLSQKDHGKAQMSWVTEGGRRLLRVHVPGVGRGDTFYSDAQTGRIQRIEGEGPDVLTHPERIRWTLDYPSLAAVDRSRFRYEVPAGMTVWDQTDGPSRWAHGDEAICLDRIKSLREALRRYANEHGGRWPESLRPALDPYVPSADVFRCPFAAAADAGFEYHRPGELLAPRALAAWNRRKADPSAMPELNLMGARPAVLECRRAGGPVFSLYADGSTINRWYPQPAVAPPVAVPPPAPRAPLDPRAAAVLKAWEEREKQLDDVMVTYDYRATYLVPFGVPDGDPRSGRTTKRSPGDFMNSHVTWARKGQKMLKDEDHRLPGDRGRWRWITDGDAVLLQTASRSGQPLSGPTAQGSHCNMVDGGDVGAVLPWGRVAEIMKRNPEIRYVGEQPVGRDRCVVLEMIEPSPGGSRSRLWFDTGHGSMLRRWVDYAQDRVQTEAVATGAREWAPGVYLATRIDELGYLQADRPSVATHRWTTVVRSVRVGGLSDDLFQPVSADGTQARGRHSPRKHVKLAGRASR